VCAGCLYLTQTQDRILLRRHQGESSWLGVGDPDYRLKLSVRGVAEPLRDRVESDKIGEKVNPRDLRRMAPTLSRGILSQEPDFK